MSSRGRWVFAAILVVSCLGLANKMTILVVSCSDLSKNTGGKADLYGTCAGRAAVAIVKGEEGGAGNGADADSPRKTRRKLIMLPIAHHLTRWHQAFCWLVRRFAICK